jgi:magnesium-transporting ATPase (P-type)
VSLPYALSTGEVLDRLRSSGAGLTSAEAAQRLVVEGPNALPEPPRRPAWRRLVTHFHDVLIYILLVSAALKAFLQDWVDLAVILAVVVINVLVGVVQEGRAQRALDALRTMLSLDAQVRRDGDWRLVAATALVPGDVVRLRPGDRVPADLRLLDATNLQVDEAALTGESVPVPKDVAPVAADAGVGDRTSMVYSGTLVTSGSAQAVVTGTGAATEIGRIQAMVAEVGRLDTPLARQLDRLGRQLSVLIAVMTAAMLVIGGVVHDFALDELVSAAIGFAVAAVPEGLPALVTITLALGVQQMAHRRAICRRLTAVEALGSVTTICSDKTGTLTQNEMTARTVATAVGRYAVDGLGYAPEGHVRTADGHLATPAEHPDLGALLRAAAACVDARVEEQDGRWRVVGQPTEGALTVLAAKAGACGDGLYRVAHLPFESARKYSATLDDRRGDRLVHVVGAPDRLLDRSAWQLSADGEEPLDRRSWEHVIDELGGQGLRVLAAARLDVPDDRRTLVHEDVAAGLTFLGVVGIVDPPRPEAVAAIAECHRAGIRVKMITGDHAGTALAIARELGMAPRDGPVPILTGAELEAMSDDELARRVRDVDVYARTSPEHKLRIVGLLQAQGEVAAMTGDGVNDAPALTRADVGVAMGIKGTEATKEAADIVLADDNFATIERAVEEGRRIYDNIRKSVVFLLPTNGAQSLVVLVAVLLGLTLPLAPVQILWINLVTAVTLSLALSGEPAEPGIMDRPPRPPREPVLSRPTVALILFASVLIGASALLVYLLERALGAGHGTAQTAAVAMLALGQLAFLFNCRFLTTSSIGLHALRGNRLVLVAAAALVALQLVFTYAPVMHVWFRSAPLAVRDWGIAAGLAVVIFLLVELGKVAVRRLGTRSAVSAPAPAPDRTLSGTGRGTTPSATPAPAGRAAGRRPTASRRSCRAPRGPWRRS